MLCVLDPTSPTMFKELTTTHTNVEYQQMYGAKIVFVFFKTDSSVSNTAGSNFTCGAGIALSALAAAICMTATKMKKEQAA